MKCEECGHTIAMCLCIGIEHRAADAELALVVAFLRQDAKKLSEDTDVSNRFLGQSLSDYADALERGEHKK